MYTAYTLKKEGDNIQQPCLTPSPTVNQSVVPCLVLTVASWPIYSFLRGQVRRSGIPTSLRIFHSVLWSTRQWSRSRSFSRTPLLSPWSNDEGNFISGSSASWKPGCTSRSSRFMYCLSLVWRILCITLLACEMSPVVISRLLVKPLSLQNMDWPHPISWKEDFKRKS